MGIIIETKDLFLQESYYFIFNCQIKQLESERASKRILQRRLFNSEDPISLRSSFLA